MKLNIGDTIKYLRKEKDITQDELADILGVSYQSVSRWETGTCYPDMELLPVISDFFGVTVDKLLGVNENIERERLHNICLVFRNRSVKVKFMTALPLRGRVLQNTRITLRY